MDPTDKIKDEIDDLKKKLALLEELVSLKERVRDLEIKLALFDPIRITWPKVDIQPFIPLPPLTPWVNPYPSPYIGDPIPSPWTTTTAGRQSAGNGCKVSGYIQEF